MLRGTTLPAGTPAPLHRGDARGPGVDGDFAFAGRHGILLARRDRELPADAYRLVEDERVIAGWGWWPGAGDGPVPDGEKPES